MFGLSESEVGIYGALIIYVLQPVTNRFTWVIYIGRMVTFVFVLSPIAA